jgi:hypothetical protein
MKEDIERTLKILINMRLKDIGRSADLEWFVFNMYDPLESNRKDEQLHSEYTLHAECAWRIVDPESVIVGSRDRYYRAGIEPYSDIMEFEWDVPGSNRCDEKVSNLIKSRANKPLIVLSITADHYGSLCIRFSDELTLELFPDDSLEGEYWRFFKLGSNSSHFVVTGKGVIESSDQ